MTEQLADVGVILGALKCSFASALIKEKNLYKKPRLQGNVVAGTLILKIVHNDAVAMAGSAKSAGPFIFPINAGVGSILPSFSSEINYTNTITTTINFRYYLYARDARVCYLHEEASRVRYGFSEWLSAVISGIDKNVGYDPQGQVDSFSYASEFAVSNVTKGGVDFDIVFLKASASALADRKDIQSLSFKIAPVSAENRAPAGAFEESAVRGPKTAEGARPALTGPRLGRKEKLPVKQPPSEPTPLPKPPGLPTTPGTRPAQEPPKAE